MQQPAVRTRRGVNVAHRASRRGMTSDDWAGLVLIVIGAALLLNLPLANRRTRARFVGPVAAPVGRRRSAVADGPSATSSGRRAHLGLGVFRDELGHARERRSCAEREAALGQASRVAA
jgi:hypothetical protein